MIDLLSPRYIQQWTKFTIFLYISIYLVTGDDSETLGMPCEYDCYFVGSAVDVINGTLDQNDDCVANDREDCCVVNCPDGTIKYGYISNEYYDGLVNACVYPTQTGSIALDPQNINICNNYTPSPTINSPPTTRTPTVTGHGSYCETQCHYIEDNDATIEGTLSGGSCIANNKDECCIIDCSDGSKRYGYVAYGYYDSIGNGACIWVINNHEMLKKSDVCKYDVVSKTPTNNPVLASTMKPTISVSNVVSTTKEQTGNTDQLTGIPTENVQVNGCICYGLMGFMICIVLEIMGLY